MIKSSYILKLAAVLMLAVLVLTSCISTYKNSVTPTPPKSDEERLTDDASAQETISNSTNSDDTILDSFVFPQITGIIPNSPLFNPDNYNNKLTITQSPSFLLWPNNNTDSAMIGDYVSYGYENQSVEYSENAFFTYNFVISENSFMLDSYNKYSLVLFYIDSESDPFDSTSYHGPFNAKIETYTYDYQGIECDIMYTAQVENAMYDAFEVGKSYTINAFIITDDNNYIADGYWFHTITWTEEYANQYSTYKSYWEDRDRDSEYIKNIS